MALLTEINLFLSHSVKLAVLSACYKFCSVVSILKKLFPGYSLFNFDVSSTQSTYHSPPPPPPPASRPLASMG